MRNTQIEYSVNSGNKKVTSVWKISGQDALKVVIFNNFMTT